MRLLAGLQESRTVENLLPQLIETERQQVLKEKQRVLDERRSVLRDFDTFQSKIDEYKDMIEVVSLLFEEKNRALFVEGLLESKYSELQKFADMVINDDITVSMSYLEENYQQIKASVDKIQKITTTLNEDAGLTYFVARPLITDEDDHGLNVFVFRNQTLEEKVSNEILYGAKIVFLSEDISVVRYRGNKYYTKFSLSQINMLEKKGFLI